MKMLVSLHLCLLLVFLQARSSTASKGRRNQKLEEDRLRPYIGRVEPEELCKLLKCYKPVGSWCQVVEEDGVRVPKCVCPKSCPRQVAPVCSVLGKTYGNQCLLHKEACRKRRRTGLAHQGHCIVPEAVCSEGEYGQFPFRLLDWFLLLSRMGDPGSNNTSSIPSTPLPQSCLSREQRRRLAEWRFGVLDQNKDGKLGRRDLKKLRYKHMPLEHCAQRFFQSCDADSNKKVTLREWTGCLVDRSEIWFQQFMSMKMGSSKLCLQMENNH
ncbi:SPARC protein [Huso huso]|uniref:SPARC protein n=1 Tax=Huso huso TaxID=61971 RepID=A0ABR0ZBQ3_HUSHU